MPSNISVCMVIFEMSEPKEKLDSASGSDGKNPILFKSSLCFFLEVSQDVTQGRREPRDYSVETFSGRKVEPSSFFSKSRSVSESSNRMSSVEPDLDETKDRDTLSFFSGNPYVEATRGILHLDKEKLVSFN